MLDHPRSFVILIGRPEYISEKLAYTDSIHRHNLRGSELIETFGPFTRFIFDTRSAYR